MKSQSTPPPPKWGMAGIILGAIGASICCIGPLLLLSLGIGGVWVSSLVALEAYRPIFIGATLIFLGLAFYRVYRPSRNEDCEPGSVCAAPATKRGTKMLLWAVTLIALGLIAFPYIAPELANAGQQSSVAPPQTETAILKVENMTCAGCALTAEKSLTSIDGVVAASVTFESGKARVIYDPTRVNQEDLVSAIERAGYPSEIITQGSPK